MFVRMIDFGLGILASIIASDIYSRVTEKTVKKQLQDVIRESSLSEGLHLMETVFDIEDTPKKDLLYKKLSEKEIPTKELIAEALFERWLLVRMKFAEDSRDDFFNQPEDKSRINFDNLSIKIWRVLAGCRELKGSLIEQQQAMQNSHLEELLLRIESISKTREFEKLTRYSIQDLSLLNRIFPGSKTEIDEIYVSPLARSQTVDDYLVERVIHGDITEDLINLIAQQNCLVIKGGYGSGKSITLKMIRNKLAESSLNVYYFGGNEWTEYLDSNPDIDALLKEASEVTETIYIIIDSIEEFCDFGEDNGQKNHYEKVFLKFQKISKNTNIKLIVSVRDVFTSDIDMVLKICYMYATTEFPKNTQIITLRGFNNDRRKEWLERYEDTIDPDVKNYKLVQLRKNRDLRDITGNPLGLYVLSKALTNSDIKLDQLSVTTYYTSFIASTIKGKFAEESIRGAYFLKKLSLVDEYKEFVKGLCLLLFKLSEENKDQKNLDIDYSQEWPIDPNEIRYDNTQEKARELAIDFISKNTKLSLQNEKVKSSLLASLLSCYFFTWKEKDVILKDDNILHYFLAEDVIEKLSCESKPNIEKLLETLSISGKSLNYCIDFIEWLSEHQKSTIADNAVKIVVKYLFCEQLHIQRVLIRRQSVKNLISLFILCLRMNWLNWESSKSNEILQAVPIILWLDESLTLGYKSLIFRSPMSIRLDNQKVSNIDFSRFNFSYSVLNNVAFENCTFDDTLFKKATFNSVTFSNCSLGKLEFDSAMGDAEFHGCAFNNTVIDNVPKLFMKFSECRLRHVILDVSSSDSENQSKKNFSFTKTYFDDVKMKQKKPGKSLVNILFKECMLSSILVRNAIVDIYTSKSFNPHKGIVDNESIKPVKFLNSEVRFYGSNEQMKL